MNYNLLHEKWIPVLYRDGRWERVGIRKALEEAGRIRQIAASNPMDRVAILRFLLAILYWCKGSPPDTTDNSSVSSFPKDWFAKLDDNAESFNLLGERKPGEKDRFFQDNQLPQDLLTEKQKQRDDREAQKKQPKAAKRAGTSGQRATTLNESDFRPIGDLLQEFPTETKIAHFRHVRDKDYGLCPACCAVGIIRFSAFANAYGGGRYTSAVNGPTPAYAIPQGATLLQTLLLNWRKCTGLNREPPWLCNEAPSLNELDPPIVFAWRSRRLWLGGLEESEQPCSYCGQPTRLIKQLAFTGGWKPPFQTKGTQKKFWDQDPHLIFESRKKGKDEADDNPGATSNEETAFDNSTTTKPGEFTTLGFPAPGSSVTAHTRFWRRALTATLAREHGTDSSAIPLAVAVAGPAANKGLYQDAAVVSLRFVSDSVKTAARDVVAFQTGAMQKLIAVLRQSTPNPLRQHPNRKAALDARSPSLETSLCEEFDKWLKSPAPPAGGTPPPVESWHNQLIEHLRPVVEAVVAATTPGSPLRRQEAMRRADQVLREAIWQTGNRMQMTNKASASGDAGGNEDAPNATAKPRCSRKKGAES